MVNILVQIIFIHLIAFYFQIIVKNANASIVFTDGVRPGKNDDMYLILLSDNADKRNLGDRKANYKDWMFMVLITNVQETRVCSGTLVTNNFVLTSAWCLMQRREEKPKIFVSYNLHSLKQQDLVCSYGVPYIHPLYTNTKNGIGFNDIALIKLDLELPILSTNLVKLDNIYSSTSGVPVNTDFKVASWAINNIVFPSPAGNTEIHFNSKASLYELKQKWTNVQHCITLLGIPPKQAENFICTKTQRMMKPVGALYGDGGSPLMSQGIQIGIAIGPTYRTSLEKCGLSIWTNVGPYISWINEVIHLSPTEREIQPQPTKETPLTIVKKIHDACRTFKLYSCNKKRGNNTDTLYTLISNYLLYCRNGPCFCDSSFSTDGQDYSDCEETTRLSNSMKDDSYAYELSKIDILFPNSRLINLYEIVVGIIMLFGFLLFLKFYG